MAKSIEQWIKEDVKPLKRKGQKYVSEQAFFRNPMRATMLDTDHMFAPADGILVEQKVVESGEEAILDVKGKPYTLNELMCGEYFDDGQPVAVANIFLTQYHRHRINLPFPGYNSTEVLDSIKTYNRPMIEFEKQLEKGIIDWNEGEYLFTNERRLDTIVAPKLGITYYMVWVADFDVANLNHYHTENQNGHLGQNDEVGMMQYGSSIFLISPIGDDFDIDFAQEIGTCVYAKQDPLFNII